jgi:uncharacterized protein
VGLLFRHRMPTIEFVRGSTVPTALILAERDAVVPPWRSAPLRPAIKNLVFEQTVVAGHNDIYDHPAFAAAIREARVGRTRRAPGLSSGRCCSATTSLMAG